MSDGTEFSYRKDLRAIGMSGRVHIGQCASPGFVDGPIAVVETKAVDAAETGDAESERGLLIGAIEGATKRVADLMEAAGGDAADVLEFQFEMLGDEALSAPAFEAIADGISAREAWSQVADALVTDFESTEDEYFKARASDIADIRDNVLLAFEGQNTQLSLPENAIFVGDDITPSRFLSVDWAGRAIALRKGSVTSHVAMLARSRNIPMLVNLGDVTASNGEAALLDAISARLVCDPDENDRQAFVKARDQYRTVEATDSDAALREPVTADGERIAVMINIADPSELETIDPAICDGIGLVRTELMFAGRDQLPDEEEQFAAYRAILEWADGRPVIIRTLDAGGDKPIKGYTMDGEANPFLGLRGVRLSLRHPDIFRQQIRGLLRAAPYGNLKVMIPMVSRPEEMLSVRRLFASEVDDLSRAVVPHRKPDIGMMVEVPASAYLFDRFDIDFGSVGSNDLAQYVMAAGRDSAEVSDLAKASEPAVLHAIKAAVDGAKKCGVPISLCGDAGSDPDLIPALLATGLRAVSCAPSAVGAVKQAIGLYRDKSK